MALQIILRVVGEDDFLSFEAEVIPQQGEEVCFQEKTYTVVKVQHSNVIRKRPVETLYHNVTVFLKEVTIWHCTRCHEVGEDWLECTTRKGNVYCLDCARQYDNAYGE